MIAPSKPTRPSPDGIDDHLNEMETLFNDYAGKERDRQAAHSGYYRAVTSLAKFYVPAGARVLELGSGSGDLLAALRPSRGVGIELSEKMVAVASAKHPGLTFRKMTAEHLETDGETF